MSISPVSRSSKTVRCTSDTRYERHLEQRGERLCLWNFGSFETPVLLWGEPYAFLPEDALHLGLAGPDEAVHVPRAAHTHEVEVGGEGRSEHAASPIKTQRLARPSPQEARVSADGAKARPKGRPVYMHLKAYSIDGQVSRTGSTNFSTSRTTT